MTLFHFYKHIVSLFRRTKPSNIALLITERCNARCIMCNIWKGDLTSASEMSVDQYDALLRKPFFHDIVNVMLSGGEALLRNDVEQIITVILTRLPRLKRITIATNGLATSVINEKMLAIASAVNRFNGSVLLVSQVSFDAMTEVHDQIRAPDASIKVKNTLNKLIELRNKYAFFKISAGCVIQPKNIDEVEDVFNYLEQNEIDSIFTVVCFDEYYYANNVNEELFFDDANKTKLKKILTNIIHKEKNVGKKFLYYQFSSMLEGGRNNRGCPALRDTITINPDGDVIPCLNSCGNILGNVFSDEVHDIWFSPATEKICKNIADERCYECMFACGVGYFEALKFAVRTFGGRFLD